MPQLRRQLLESFPQRLTRTCGYPPCSTLLTVDLFAAEPFRGPIYCEPHRVIGSRHRRRLLKVLAQIDQMLFDAEAGAPLPRVRDGEPWTGISKKELIQWKRRLTWELTGMAASDA